MAETGSIDLREYIRNIADFPKPGIMFKDITPLLASPRAFRAAIAQLGEQFSGRGVDVIAAAEARGFIFGAPLAMEMGRVRAHPKAGQAPLRHHRPGIPARVRQRPPRGPHRRPHGGPSSAPARRRACHRWDHAACRDLVLSTGAELVACAFVIELSFLEGRAKLEPCEVFSLITY